MTKIKIFELLLPPLIHFGTAGGKGVSILKMSKHVFWNLDLLHLYNIKAPPPPPKKSK